VREKLTFNQPADRAIASSADFTDADLRPTGFTRRRIHNRLVVSSARKKENHRMVRYAYVLLSAALLFPPAAASADTVNVLYAGSLVNLMEHGVGPAFDKATGDKFQGFGGGSNGLANQIKGRLRHGDVFISANPKVNQDLTGAANGDWVNWYVTFARSPLVIGYSPTSRFAAALKTKPWYEVLQEPGIKIGRTDPKLDPKGAFSCSLTPNRSINSRVSPRRSSGRPTIPIKCDRKKIWSDACSRAKSTLAFSIRRRRPTLRSPPSRCRLRLR
jgi:hypothetical protein